MSLNYAEYNPIFSFEIQHPFLVVCSLQAYLVCFMLLFIEVMF